MKNIKTLVSSVVLAAVIFGSASVVGAHPAVNVQTYHSFKDYKVALDKQLSYDWSHAYDQFELDRLNAQYYADIAIATVYFNGQGTGFPRLRPEGYKTYASYKAELDKLFSYDWDHAHDQWELDRLNAQYDADIAAAKIYYGVK